MQQTTAVSTLCTQQSFIVNQRFLYFLYIFFLLHSVLQGHRILVKVRQGENIITDMRKVQKEGETNCSSLWRQAALCAVNATQQIAYYKNCVASFEVFRSVLTLILLNPNRTHPPIRVKGRYQHLSPLRR